jgi:hypothetical protein
LTICGVRGDIMEHIDLANVEYSTLEEYTVDTLVNVDIEFEVERNLSNYLDKLLEFSDNSDISIIKTKDIKSYSLILKEFGLSEDIIFAIGDVLSRQIDNSNDSEPTEHGFCGTITHRNRKIYVEIIFANAIDFVIDLRK